MKQLTMMGILIGMLAVATGAFAADKYKPAQLQAAAKACGSVNGLCPVMGTPVDPKGGSSTYQGEKIAFCCAGCSAKFNADPTRYMDLMRMDAPKYWYASSLPSVVEMRKAKGLSQSTNGRCPVMGKTVVPKTGGSSVYKGQKVQFCCRGCIGKFNKNPEKYMRMMRADPLAFDYTRPGPSNAQLRAARTAAGSANGLCPIMKRPVTPTGGSVVYKGEKISFCCGGCAKKFQANPEAYMSAMRAEPAVYGYVPSKK